MNTVFKLSAIATLVVFGGVCKASGHTPTNTSTTQKTKSFAELIAVPHARIGAQLQPGQWAFFGDSITQAWNVTDVRPQGVSFGVGGFTSTDVLRHIDTVKNTCLAGNAVVMIGITDILHGFYKDLIANIPKIAEKLSCARVVWMGILHPTDKRYDRSKHAAINNANALIKETCELMPNCGYLQTPSLTKNDYYTDGVHPNPTGYRKINAVFSLIDMRL